ncbi:MAG TPA: 50S ribosomal protein L10 [Thiotrichaceae bacterium]|nr:50S ribosomal protein L10 [Thiotrichaceae bacterium]
MALTLEAKKQIVSEVAEVAASAHSAIAADYSGISVSQMTELRVKARADDVYLRVVKNNLAKIALKDTEFECMTGDLSGPMILAFSQEDPGAAARVVKDFAKEQQNFEVKMIALGGELLDVSQLDSLSKMPTRDQAIAILMATMRAPVEKLAKTLNEVPGKLVRTVAAIRDDKEATA